MGALRRPEAAGADYKETQLAPTRMEEDNDDGDEWEITQWMELQLVVGWCRQT